MQFIDLKAQRQRIGDKIDVAISRVLEHGNYIMGPEVDELERQLSAFCGAEHAISCASGTDALLLVLMAWGIGPKDAVFVPSFTFASTAEVVALLGATPVFVDVEEDSFTMSPSSLEMAYSEAKRLGLKPRAIIPVDLFGQPADYDRLLAFAESQGMSVLADAAQSFGATLRGRRTGTFGHATATSFFPAKPLGCYGDGGAVFTDSEELAEIIKSLRVHGKGRHKYDNVRIGINGRLDTLQAAILLEKLSIFSDELQARQRIGDAYNQALESLVCVPRLASGATSAWAQYTIRLSGRDDVARLLGQAGIPTAVYYPQPLHRQTAYKEFPVPRTGLPVSDRLSGEVLSLPMHPYLDSSTIHRIQQELGRILASG